MAEARTGWAKTAPSSFVGAPGTGLGILPGLWRSESL